MDRRRFLLASGLTAGTVGLAGCTSIPLIGGGQTPPPPRKSSVFTDVEAIQDGIVLELPDQPWVQSRAEVDNSGALAPPDDVSPVGIAAAAKGSKGSTGATGRGDGGHRSAPRSTHGHAKWHGDDDEYEEWREEHEDEVRRYDAAAAAVGIAYLGSNAAYDDSEPGPGAPPGGWDERMQSVDGTRVVYETDPQNGWYRSGARLEAAGADHEFGWEVVDYKLEDAGSNPKVDRVWKISPRL